MHLFSYCVWVKSVNTRLNSRLRPLSLEIVFKNSFIVADLSSDHRSRYSGWYTITILVKQGFSLLISFVYILQMAVQTVIVADCLFVYLFDSEGLLPFTRILYGTHTSKHDDQLWNSECLWWSHVSGLNLNFSHLSLLCFLSLRGSTYEILK